MNAGQCCYQTPFLGEDDENHDKHFEYKYMRSLSSRTCREATTNKNIAQMSSSQSAPRILVYFPKLQNTFSVLKYEKCSLSFPRPMYIRINNLKIHNKYGKEIVFQKQINAGLTTDSCPGICLIWSLKESAISIYLEPSCCATIYIFLSHLIKCL